MEEKKQSKTVFVLEGGAMRGLYSAGVLDVFMKKGISTDAIYGVSAGALFGINFKSKQIGRAIRYNLKYAHEKNYMGLYSLITTGNIMNEKFCFDRIVNELDKFDFDTFNTSPIDFYAVVTNVETGKAEHVKITDSRAQLEVLRASGSMPFVSKIVEFEGSKYLDGAISDPIPLRKALDEGYEKIVVVLTRPENYSKHKENLPYKWIYKKYQLRSRLTARGWRPPSIQLLHWPYTLLLHSLCPSRIHSESHPSYLSRGRYQCLVSFFTSSPPLRADLGLMSSSGLRVAPHFSHWSP